LDSINFLPIAISRPIAAPHQVLIKNLNRANGNQLIPSAVPTLSMNLAMFDRTYPNMLQRFGLSGTGSQQQQQQHQYELEDPIDPCSEYDTCSLGPTVARNNGQLCCSTNVAEFLVSLTGATSCSSFVWNNNMPNTFCSGNTDCAPCKYSRAIAISSCMEGTRGPFVLYQCVRGTTQTMNNIAQNTNLQIAQSHEPIHQSIQQYNQFTQPIQQYNQPIQQYSQFTQPIQQYSQFTQPIQQFTQPT